MKGLDVDAPEKIPPALTAEQWKDADRVRGLLYNLLVRENLPYGLPGLMAITNTGPMQLPGYWSFTRDDLEAIRAMMDSIPSYSDWMPRLKSLAARIEALLPPEP